MDENGDSGSIKGLPAGWIDGSICARRLFARLRADYADADPAPWHNVVNPQDWGPHLGKTPEEYTLNEKLNARLVAIFQKAVCSGQLTPSWFDGSGFKSIPAYAFGNSRVVYGALLCGGFEVDPLWPDEWQTWSGHGWAIPKNQFESWAQSNNALSMAGLPMPESEMPPCDVESIGSRKPSEASRVPLSEAVTWIAFGVALDAERLGRSIRWERLADGDLQAAQRQMEAATATLLKAGADGLVPMFGRHMEAHGEKGKRTEKIDPLTLEDYRKAWITGQDSLHYGTGLFVWYRAPNDSLLRGSDRGDHFANVTVERDAMLKHCGSRLDSMAALLMPIPAALPEIGSVMGMEEALCLIAHNRPSKDLLIWETAAGELVFRDSAGMVHTLGDGKEVPEELARDNNLRRAAGLAVWNALQGGFLSSYVAPETGRPLAVPRIYWNSQNPEGLDSIYRGMSETDHGRGCPVLLSRLEFDKWRAAVATLPVANTESRSTVNGERECKVWLLSEFALDVDKKRSKKSFKEEALKQFAGRLSVRGFIRAWDTVAPQAGRSKPGRKS